MIIIITINNNNNNNIIIIIIIIIFFFFRSLYCPGLQKLTSFFESGWTQNVLNSPLLTMKQRDSSLSTPCECHGKEFLFGL